MNTCQDSASSKPLEGFSLAQNRLLEAQSIAVQLTGDWREGNAFRLVLPIKSSSPASLSSRHSFAASLNWLHSRGSENKKLAPACFMFSSFHESGDTGHSVIAITGLWDVCFKQVMTSNRCLMRFNFSSPRCLPCA